MAAASAFFTTNSFSHQSDGVFDTFSDRDSRIAHLDKIGKLLCIVGFANILIGITNPVGPVNLLCASLLMYALGRIQEKADKLKRDRQIFE